MENWILTRHIEASGSRRKQCAIYLMSLSKSVIPKMDGVAPPLETAERFRGRWGKCGHQDSGSSISKPWHTPHRYIVPELLNLRSPFEKIDDILEWNNIKCMVPIRKDIWHLGMKQLLNLWSPLEKLYDI